MDNQTFEYTCKLQNLDFYSTVLQHKNNTQAMATRRLDNYIMTVQYNLDYLVIRIIIMYVMDVQMNMLNTEAFLIQRLNSTVNAVLGPCSTVSLIKTLHCIVYNRLTV